LANTGIVLSQDWMSVLSTPNGLGILGGLLLGKPFGVLLMTLLAVFLGVCQLPADLKWRHVFGAGLLGGIGFTMSIFITNLAFAADPVVINASKITILCASIFAGAVGYFWLRGASAVTLR
jgi:NhaA family Na+:H+ antiporter